MTKIFGKPSTEGLPYSKSLKAGSSIYLSGLTGCDEAGNLVSEDLGEQVRHIMAQAETELGHYNATLSDVVKVVVYLPDPDDFELFNGVYATFFHKNAPTRTTVHAAVPGGALVEIDFTAYQP